MSNLDYSGIQDGLVSSNGESDAEVLDCVYWNQNSISTEPINSCLLSTCPCCTIPCWTPERKKDMWGLLKMETFYMIVIQIIFFIFSLCISDSSSAFLSPSTSALISMGANDNSLFKHNYGFWRLITAVLLHGSIWHIILNIYSQATFCLGFEKSWGIVRYSIVYWGSAIIANLCTNANTSYSVSVGASSAICGVLGCYIALFVTYWSQLSHDGRIPMLINLVTNLAFLVIISFTPHVDWRAHFGGLIGGASIGCIVFHSHGKTQMIQKCLLYGGIGVVLACIIIPIIVIASSDI